ncbi:MAG TPA: FUSC family protein [Solirubrobacteraceae bacterium]|nr:FUSC family protein [Solirubrobacteraceae bacterium]
MIRPSSMITRARGAAGAARVRLRGRMLAVVQTAAAAVVAWYVAVLLLPDPRPAFAAIAAVIAVGATHGQRTGRAIQLVGGVVLGITVATLLLDVIGTGAWQMGVLVVVAMGAAVALGAPEMVVVEAGVSAILLVALDPGAATGFSPNRILEGVIGGATALAVSATFFPPDPALGPGRAAQAMFVELGRALERIAAALESRDAGAAERALVDARSIDPLLRSVEAEIETGRETAKYSPAPRASRALLDRYERSIPQIDYAVRNTRVLARNVVALVRDGDDVPESLPNAVRGLSHSVWELAASYDAPSHAEPGRRLAVRAATDAAAVAHERPDAVLVGGQVRSVAVDLVRAAELVAEDARPAHELPTEELLANPT